MGFSPMKEIKSSDENLESSQLGIRSKDKSHTHMRPDRIR